MIVTCIINQFDCNAGTRAVAFCIADGNEKLANVYVSRVIGVVIAFKKVRFWKAKTQLIWIAVKDHDRKINDSYRLLRGKCPESIQRRISNTAKRIFAIQIPKKVLLGFFVRFGKNGSIHDQSITTNT